MMRSFGSIGSLYFGNLIRLRYIAIFHVRFFLGYLTVRPYAAESSSSTLAVSRGSLSQRERTPFEILTGVKTLQLKWLPD